MRIRLTIAAAVLTAGCAARIDPSKPVYDVPRTRAEASNYTETSTYGDVMAFINGLRARNAALGYGSIGKTTQGREIPYLIASRPSVTTPEEARRLGRPIVYVNANIHAGEVEGKEALLELVRDLISERRANVLDSLVLVAIPIYNADGNEVFKPQAINRTEQNGPEMVGQRPNGMGLDLNRDYVKAEAPETRASLAMFNRWDPDVYVDLHTTDGSFHGYALTYSPSLNPASYVPGFPGALTRDTLLPEIRARMHARGYEVFDYGNFDGGYEERDITDTVKQGWYSYEHKPRYGTNYYGMRGRVSILSEAYSHDPFKKRIASTYAFVSEILSATARHAASIEAYRQADRHASEVPIAARMTTHPFDAGVPFEIMKRTGDSLISQPGVPRGYRRTGKFKTQLMAVYDRFETTRTGPGGSTFSGYLIPPDSALVALLRRHGLQVIQQTGRSYRAEEYTIDSVTHAARAFQNHQETRVFGHWSDAKGSVAPGSGYSFVPATGRLGPLATYLLEPESDDGVVDWNLLDAHLVAGHTYPITRLYDAATNAQSH